MGTGNKKINIFLPLLLSLFLAGGMLIGNQLTRITVADRFQIYPKSNKLTGIIDFIEQEYVDSISREDLIEKTIPTILEQLDPHSVYIPASDLEQYNEPLEGNFSGIGVQFNMQDDTVVIVNTIKNGPSEKVGIIAGDRIIRVDDSLVAGINKPSDDVVAMLKGKRGTKVKVSIARRDLTDLIYFFITPHNLTLS